MPENDTGAAGATGNTGQAGAGSATAGAGTGGSGGSSQGAAGSTPATWETWLASQDGSVKGLFDAHVNGLKSALESERMSRKDLEKQLGEVSGKLGKDSAERKSLEEVQGRLGTLERQAQFYDQAHGAGVANLRLAWLAANEAKLVDDKGQVDLAKLKEQFPELFRAAAQPATNTANPANTGRGAKPLTREMIRQMSAAEINERWDEVQAVLTSK